MESLDIMATLWPSFSHFRRFAQDTSLSGIRLNSAMITNAELETELARLPSFDVTLPLYFDVKGKQLRVLEVIPSDDHLEITLNHPINVQTPVGVLFKAGEDFALLDHLEDHGHRLVFQGGPHYEVHPGESLHIRHQSLSVRGPMFTETEIRKIEQVKAYGFDRYFLSYVESRRDVDEFREIVGRSCEIMIKIESKAGLRYVSCEFKKEPHLRLVAARGDLYVELDRPHDIIKALEHIIKKDPEAVVGSRLLLSLVPIPARPDELKELCARVIEENPDAREIAQYLLTRLEYPASAVPSCADFLEMSWLYDIGYRTFMLCDELCLKEDLLAAAINTMRAFRREYAERKSAPKKTTNRALRKIFRLIS